MLNVFEKLMNPTEGTSDYTKGKKKKISMTVRYFSDDSVMFLTKNK